MSCLVLVSFVKVSGLLDVGVLCCFAFRTKLNSGGLCGPGSICYLKSSQISKYPPWGGGSCGLASSLLPSLHTPNAMPTQETQFPFIFLFESLEGWTLVFSNILLTSGYCEVLSLCECCFLHSAVFLRAASVFDFFFLTSLFSCKV